MSERPVMRLLQVDVTNRVSHGIPDHEGCIRSHCRQLGRLPAAIGERVAIVDRINELGGTAIIEAFNTPAIGSLYLRVEELRDLPVGDRHD